MSKWAKTSIIAAAYPERSAGNNPRDRVAFHHSGPTFITAYCQAAENLADQDWG